MRFPVLDFGGCIVEALEGTIGNSSTASLDLSLAKSCRLSPGRIWVEAPAAAELGLSRTRFCELHAD